MNPDRNVDPLTGFLVGAAGAVAGLYAMGLYFKHAAPVVSRRLEPNMPTMDELPAGRHWKEQLQDISVAGPRHGAGESPTGALGRIAHRQVTGHDPSEETETKYSYGVHYGHGVLMGGLYGVLRRNAPFPDLSGGALHGLALWLFGDELAVPLLGLQGGPTEVSLPQHLNRLGAHLAYGASTAAATQTLIALADSGSDRGD